MDAKRHPVEGRYTVYDITPGGLWIPLFRHQNTLMVDWGFAAARLFGYGDSSYRINRMYVEFRNVASAGDAVTVPSYENTDRRSYYENLAAPADFLRVPMTGSPEIAIASGYEPFFGDNEGNKLVFYAQTTGVAGVNGVTFSNGVNSKVYGLALVAAPDDGDRSRDVLITRGYFPTADQKVKSASGQIGLSWELDFKPLS